MNTYAKNLDMESSGLKRISKLNLGSASELEFFLTNRNQQKATVLGSRQLSLRKARRRT
jgi:hypothetical protein